MTSTTTPFDRKIVQTHRDRAAPNLKDGNDFLFMEVADRLVDRLSDVKRDFGLGLDLGCHGGEIAGILGQSGKVKTLIQADFSPAMAALAAQNGKPTITADEEFLPFANAQLDLVISNLSLHWVNDLPGTFAQIAKALKPDGFFLGAMIGGESLVELRSALIEAEAEVEGALSRRISPFVEMQDAGSLLQRAGFALPVVDSDIITVSYENPLKLMSDLRAMGESNANRERRKAPTRRETIMRAAEKYLEMYAGPDGRVPATFQIVYMAAWQPDESQQQPLPRGSGMTSLADFLTKDESDKS